MVTIIIYEETMIKIVIARKTLKLKKNYCVITVRHFYERIHGR